MRVRSVSLALSLAVLAASCGDDSWVSRPDPAGDPAPAAFSDATTVPSTTTLELAAGMEVELEAMEVARDQWRERASDTYRYVIEWACLCEQARPAMLVSVQQNQATSALELGPVEVAVDTMTSAGESFTGPTVEWLFGAIGDALADGHRVSATYDPETGVPTIVDLDVDEAGADIHTRNFSDITGGRVDLIEAQSRWDASGFTAYRWTYGVITLEGLEEITATVSNGVGDTGLSVEEVYALVAEAHVNTDQTVIATYDAELGLPLRVVIERPMNTANLPFTYTGVVSLEPL